MRDSGKGEKGGGWFSQRAPMKEETRERGGMLRLIMGDRLLMSATKNA